MYIVILPMSLARSPERGRLSPARDRRSPTPPLDRLSPRDAEVSFVELPEVTNFHSDRAVAQVGQPPPGPGPQKGQKGQKPQGGGPNDGGKGQQKGAKRDKGKGGKGAKGGKGQKPR